mgnify:CR=1 FL=1
MVVISKKSIRIHLRQCLQQHPNTYAHEHFAVIAKKVGQSEEIVRLCMLEGVVMTAYTMHCQKLSGDLHVGGQQLSDEAFIATQATRLASFGVTAEIARMAIEQYPSEISLTNAHR